MLHPPPRFHTKRCGYAICLCNERDSNENRKHFNSSVSNFCVGSILLGGSTCPAVAQLNNVHIPDSTLRTAIEEALDKTSGATITKTDMLALTTLEAKERGIEDLTGLEFATNLTELSLSDNQIVDISGLSGLTNLRGLGLDFNQISDISVLSGLIPNLRDYSNENQTVSEDVVSDATSSEDVKAMAR